MSLLNDLDEMTEALKIALRNDRRLSYWLEVLNRAKAFAPQPERIRTAAEKKWLRDALEKEGQI